MSEQIISGVGRVLWAGNLAEEDSNGKYTVKMAFEDSDELSAMRKLAEDTSKEAHGKVVDLPLKDGNELKKTDEGETWSWNKDKTIITFSTKHKPSIIGPGGGADIIDASEIYNGCYARVVLDFYGWTFKGKKGVSAGLQAIQFYKHGEQIGKKKFDPTTAFGAATETGMVSPING
jgi:hypothetical protein